MRSGTAAVPPASRAPLWPLLALAVGGAALEAALLQVQGFVSAIPLAPQLTAPAPYGTFHDLRWVWTFSWSWVSFVWELAALVCFRSLLTAAMILLAWPGDVERPPVGALLRRCLLYTLLSVVVLSLAFAAGATSAPWFMLGTLIPVGVLALVMPHGAATGSWWRRLVPWRCAVWLAATWLILMLDALALTFSPGWVTVPVAAAAGAVNAWLWRRIVHTLVHARRPRHSLPLAPISILAALALFLAGGGYVLASQSGSGQSAPPPATGGQPRQPVIAVFGYGSSYDGTPVRMFGQGFQTWHFSYRGLGPHGPVPYGPGATHASLRDSARRLAAQVEELHRRSGQPVSLVAESEGTLVVHTYLESHPHAPVHTFVMLSPLVRPARVYYPAAGEQGWGLAAGWEARLLVRMIELEGFAGTNSADEPFLRSIVEHAPQYRGHLLCPAPGVRTYAYLPLAGALDAQRGALSGVPWSAAPAYHAGLLSRGTIRSDIVALLRDQPQPHHPGWGIAFQAIRGAATAWHVPALPLRLRAAWQPAPGSDAAFAQQPADACASAG